jgi:transcriptional regulator with XRE-family HTH domain
MTREEFARRFKAAREATGLSQSGAARLLGVPQPRIAEYESGVRTPPTLRLLEIMGILGLDASTLFAPTSPEPKGR